MPILSSLFPRASVSPAEDYWDEYWATRGQRTSAGVVVNEETAFKLSAVWAATRLLCGTGGALPLNMYRRQSDGGKDIDHGHRVQTLVHDAPNPEMSSMMWRSTGINFQVNKGNTFSEIERDDGDRVLNLWPIHPSRVTFFRTTSGEIAYEVKTATNERPAEKPIIFPARDILHIPSMMSDDGINGKGVLTAAAERIGFGLNSQTHGSTFFANSARPDIVITLPGKLSKEARHNFRAEWKELHGGPQRSGGIAVLQDNATFQALGMTQQEAQFIESDQATIEDIARFFGVPVHLIQRMDGSDGYASVELKSLDFIIFSLMPWLKLWEQELWRKLLTEEEQAEYFFKFNVDALLRGDVATRTSALLSQFMNGAITLDEWRDIEDRNPVPDGLGKVHYVPHNLQTIEQSQQPPEPAPPALPSPEPPDDDEEDDTQARLLAIDARMSEMAAERQAEKKQLRAVALAQFEAVMLAMIRKEVNEVRTMGAKPETFLRRVDEFYERFEPCMAEAIAPAVVFCCSVWGDEKNVTTATDLARAHVNRSKAELLRASECKPAELADSLERCTMGWRSERSKPPLFYLEIHHAA